MQQSLIDCIRGESKRVGPVDSALGRCALADALINPRNLGHYGVPDARLRKQQQSGKERGGVNKRDSLFTYASAPRRIVSRRRPVGFERLFIWGERRAGARREVRPSARSLFTLASPAIERVARSPKLATRSY